MSSFNRQLKIWRDDFLRYYDKTSLVTRIIIGAALGFLVTYTALNYYIKPTNQEIKKLNKQINDMAVLPDVDLMLQDLNLRQRRIERQLATTKRQNQQYSEKRGVLSRSDTGKVGLELRQLIDRHSLRLVNEERVVAKPVQTVRRGSSTTLPPDTRQKLVLPETMNHESYRFHVLGSYKDIQLFLNEAFSAKSVFFINNVSIKESTEMLTDHNFRPYRALSCSFEFHIPYLAEGGL